MDMQAASAKEESKTEQSNECLAQVEKDIKEVQKNIMDVETRIQIAEKRAEDSETRNDITNRDYWRDEKKQLREKENKLREKENKLREKANLLLKNAVPEDRDRATKRKLAAMLDILLATVDLEGSSSKRSSRGDFPVRVRNYYGIHPKHCMLLGKFNTSEKVISAHIIPRSKPELFELVALNSDEIDNSRNGLRLHTAIEQAFDRRQLYFDFKPPAIFRCKLLDPSLSKQDIGHTGRSFATIDGRALTHITPEKLPYRRALALHKKMALAKARRQNWLTVEECREFDDTVAMAAFSLKDKTTLTLFFSSLENEQKADPVPLFDIDLSSSSSPPITAATTNATSSKARSFALEATG
jgi:hypothetical protein